MNVDPAHRNSPEFERPTPEKKPRPAPNPPSVDSVNVSSKNSSSAVNATVEIAKPRNIPAPLAIPEHEVKVILDTPENYTLVYKVLDKQSGDVVLQVPSAEHLRGLHDSRELQQRNDARGKAVKGEENKDGNKL